MGASLRLCEQAEAAESWTRTLIKRPYSTMVRRLFYREFDFPGERLSLPPNTHASRNNAVPGALSTGLVQRRSGGLTEKERTQ